jgi:hypothetical protein
MASAILVVLVLSGLVGGMVSVRVASPPRMLERKAGMLAMPSGPEAVEWQVRCDEAGPFPSRFDPSSLATSDAEVDRLMDSLGQPKSRYRAVMREFPKEQAADYPPAASKGERVFPERGYEDERIPDTEGVLGPHLHILAHLPVGVEPAVLPAYTQEVSPAASAKTWRFVVRVTESGRVSDCIDCTSAEGTSAKVPAEVENWVRSVRFGRKAAAMGWFGIEVGFLREP